jgi:hypothetical protein
VHLNYGEISVLFEDGSDIRLESQQEVTTHLKALPEMNEEVDRRKYS